MPNKVAPDSKNAQFDARISLRSRVALALARARALAPLPLATAEDPVKWQRTIGTYTKKIILALADESAKMSK